MNSLFLFLIFVYLGLFFDNMGIFKFTLISSILHEAGHIISYCILMKKCPSIDVSVYGFKMRNNVTQQKILVKILICGPMVNLIATILTYIYSLNTLKFDVLIFALINLSIFIFNSLPIYFLDGGQILYCLSPFYQRNYLKISLITITIVSVMLFCFTGLSWIVLLPLTYIVYNILNDI